MRAYTVRNVGEAFPLAVNLLLEQGNKTETRNGLAYEMDSPVTMTYFNPQERVLFCPLRNANPFFHLTEAMWMLAGKRDLEFVETYNKGMANYATKTVDGMVFEGAYGYRWRHHFYRDQLNTVIHRLKTYPNDRRTVLGMWDPSYDLCAENTRNDIPCNTHVYFSVRKGKLDMMVCCRSNDAVWGAYGANAVHFSFLQEYVALGVGVQMGNYSQMSFNLHGYASVLEPLRNVSNAYDSYTTSNGTLLQSQPLYEDRQLFDHELQYITSKEHWRRSYETPFLEETVSDAMYAWDLFKNGELDEAIEMANMITAEDWRKACVEWLIRVKEKKNGEQ